MPGNKHRSSSATPQSTIVPGISSNSFYFADKLSYSPIIRLVNQSFIQLVYSLLGNWSHYPPSEPPFQMEKELY